MKIELTRLLTLTANQDHLEVSEEIEASSFSEFAGSLFMGLGILLLVSFGTYLVFSGTVVILLTLIA